jgi:hypothetical protein
LLLLFFYHHLKNVYPHNPRYSFLILCHHLIHDNNFPFSPSHFTGFNDGVVRRDRAVSASHIEQAYNRPIAYDSISESPKSPIPRTRIIPIVYPALLSKVAEAFRQKIYVTTATKDGIEYKDCFDGRQAVVCM